MAKARDLVQRVVLVCSMIEMQAMDESPLLWLSVLKRLVVGCFRRIDAEHKSTRH